MTCNPCPQGCKLCLTSYLCTECSSAFSLYEDTKSQNFTCLQSCPRGYYSTSSFPHTCQPCNSNCVACSGPSSNQCTDCSDDLILAAGRCVSSSQGCPAGTYLDSGLCLSCVKGCSSCSSALNCDVCSTGYTLGESTGVCELADQTKCDLSCKTCSGTTQFDCTSCNSPSVLQTHMCVKSCGAGFILNTKSNTCEICYENCNSCLNGLFYMGGNCLFSCPTSTTAVIDEIGQVSCNLADETPILKVAQSPSETEPVALTQDLVLQVSVVYPPNSAGSEGPMTLNWVQTDKYASVTKLLQGLQLNTAVLIIPKQNLIPGQSYQVSAQVVMDGVVKASVTVSFTTAQGISNGGSFDISPVQGSFYDTEFTLSLNGWGSSASQLKFSITAYRSGNPAQKVFIATSIDLVSSHKFTIPSLYEQQYEQNVVYTIELTAQSSSDSISQLKTVTLQSLSQERITQLIANIDPRIITEPSAISNFITLITQNVIQNSEVATQTTTSMLAAYNLYQAMTGDFTVTCVDAIHCSGNGYCSPGSSTTTMCTCDAGWGGINCNKEANSLQQAQGLIKTLLTNMAAKTPTVNIVGVQMSAIQTAVRDPDLIAPGSGLPNSMASFMTKAYKVAPSSVLPTIADTAFTLPLQFSDDLSSAELQNMLSKLFGDCMDDLLALLGIGDFTTIDSQFLYLLLISVENDFEEITDEEDSDNRRLLEDAQLKQKSSRSKSRMLASTTTSTSTTSDAKKKAQLENQAATTSPFQPTSTIDKATLLTALKSLLSKIKSARKLKLKAPSTYRSTSGSFEIPQLTLRVSSKLSFSVQESKTGHNSQASNSNTLVSKSVTFTANDGKNEISITNLKMPLRVTIPKKSPSTPNNSTTLYKCSYYDETSRKYKTDGCSFLGENITHIFCQCNHATEFAAQINEDYLNSLDNFFNKPSLQDLIELSATTKLATSKNQNFTLALQKNILSKVTQAFLEYKIRRLNYWPIIISLTIFALLVLIYPCLNFLQTIQRDYFASWEPETFASAETDSEGAKKCAPKQARAFWTFYSLVHGKYEKFLTNNSVRTFSFYTEVLNLIGSSLLWTLFFNARSQSSTILTYMCAMPLAVATNAASYYLTLGLLAHCKIRSIRKYHQCAEKGLTYSTSRFTLFENIQLGMCVVIIVGWLILFGVFSTLLTADETRMWMICCLGASVVSYFVLDGILVLIYSITKREKLFLTLALRSLSGEYMS